MKRRKDPYAALHREVMPFGTYAGKRFSQIPVDYCKNTLRKSVQLNPLVRDLLLLRIEYEKNWLQELKKDVEYYENLAAEYEAEAEKYKAELQEIHQQRSDNLAGVIDPFLRILRRRFAARYHPDMHDGSAEMMAMVNRIFNELAEEIKSDH
ncbi:hypothetical protein [Stieleria varia]|uniref:Uncharacterized protein n=1 Tax=Stieleria varia TaxID=2528005 RepID=A0A5C6AS49_9BACT|nr:hypothetical protein [Stieleria varia]TWU02237.1 hypothetical protein Pla52n_32870 [Stieleria varia]